ncbi:MAG: endonuclease/exonuclease/phosphatase family protein [Candidatus Limnocylindrales bacterium]
MTLRVATYNVRFGGVGRKASIAAVLSKLAPDVVLLQEATDPPTVAWIGQELGLAHVVAVHGRSVAALSREPIESAWHELGHGRQALEILLGADRPRIFAVHLAAGLSRRGENRRRIEATHLIEQVDSSGGSEETMLVGDFNAISPGDGPLLRRLPMWIRILLRFDGGIRTEVMASLASAGFTDGYRLLHPDEPGFTMPAVEPSVRLDYFLLGSAVHPLLLSCEQQAEGLQSALASDHLALVAEFDLR